MCWLGRCHSQLPDLQGCCHIFTLIRKKSLHNFNVTFTCILCNLWWYGQCAENLGWVQQVAPCYHGSDLVFRHINSSGKYLWTLASGCWWQILWVLWVARWGLNSRCDLGNLEARSIPGVLYHLSCDDVLSGFWGAAGCTVLLRGPLPSGCMVGLQGCLGRVSGGLYSIWIPESRNILGSKERNYAKLWIKTQNFLIKDMVYWSLLVCHLVGEAHNVTTME